MASAATLPHDEPEYQPFPELPDRDLWQARFEIPLLATGLGLRWDQDVLETGCGNANAMVAFARQRHPRRLAGVDVDPVLLARARANLDAAGVVAELVEADVRALPFPDASFDVVLDFGTLWHIARQVDALHEIARVLRPGGLLVHETRLNQLLAHPVRSQGRHIPWEEAPLVPHRQTVLFASRRRA